MDELRERRVVIAVVLVASVVLGLVMAAAFAVIRTQWPHWGAPSPWFGFLLGAVPPVARMLWSIRSGDRDT